jgi:hypothetical protein
VWSDSTGGVASCRGWISGENRADRNDIDFKPVKVTGGRNIVTVRVGEVDIEIADPAAVSPKWIATVVAELVGR